MPKDQEESVFVLTNPVVTDYSDSNTVDNLATAEQQESEDVLSQETVGKKKRHAETVMTADTEDVLIQWFQKTPLLVLKGFERLQRYSEWM